MEPGGDPIRKLVHHLSRLPGIGEKTATRLTYHLLRMPEEYVRDLSQALVEIKTRIQPCSICCNLTQEDPCDICRDLKRSDESLCVVEQPSDVAALEKGREYRGRYHILHGALSPLDGIGPSKLRISELLKRLEGGRVLEVIMATDPDVEGDATALYLARLIRAKGIRVTRLARGLPVGSELEYVDNATLLKALENRQEL